MASVTITTTAPQDLRLAPALGDYLGLGRDATTLEVKTMLINRLRDIVQSYEHRIAVVAAFDPT